MSKARELKAHFTGEEEPVKKRGIVKELDYNAPFPFEIFPEKLQILINEAERANKIPKEYLALIMLTNFAAALGTAVKLKLKNEFEVHACLFLCIVGDSGVGKTPALQTGLKPVKKINELLFDEFIKKEYLWKEKGTPKDPPTMQQLIIDDTTMEAAKDLHKNNLRGLFCVQDEITGWIHGMNKYNGGDTDITDWMKIQSGESININRKNSYTKVKHTCINLLGGTQPDKLIEFVKNGRDKSGFFNRFLFAVVDKDPSFWNEENIDPNMIQNYIDMVLRVNNIELVIKDNFGHKTAEPKTIVMNEAAKVVWKDWFDNNISFILAQPKEKRVAFQSYFFKLENYCARLALIMQSVYYSDGKTTLNEVGPEAVDAATRLAEYFRGQYFKVAKIVKLGIVIDDNEDARKIVNLLNTGISNRRIQKLLKVSPNTITNIKKQIDIDLSELPF